VRAYEFLSERPIQEDKSSGATQFNSELGCMLGFVSGTATFEKLLAGAYNKKLLNAEGIIAQATKDKEMYEQDYFNKWVTKGAAIKSKIGYNGKVGWDGVGQGNKGGVADVVFEDDATHSGISIKEKSGVTLTNTSPKELGFDYTGDIFKSYFKEHWNTWKTKVIDKVLAAAESAAPDRVIGAPNDKKSQTGRDKIRAIQYNHEDHTDEAGKVYPAKTYSIWYGKGPDIN